MARVPEQAPAALLGPLAGFISQDALRTDDVDAFRLGLQRFRQAPPPYPSKPSYEYILDYLCNTGCARLVRFLLDERLCTPSLLMLKRAASDGRVAVMRAIIDSGISVNLNALLASAAQNGNVDVMEVLLDAGASPNGSSYNVTEALPPLHGASSSGSVDAVRLLIRRGADVNATTAWGGTTPLWYAADRGDAAVVAELLASGASMQADKAGITPLMMAVVRGAVNTVKVLAAHGADVEVLSKGGHTAISLASRHSGTDVLRCLLDCYSNISLTTLTGALWVAVSAESSARDVELLLARGANARSVQNGQSLISKAAETGRLATVDVLLDAGADPLTVTHAELHGAHAVLPNSFAQFAQLSSLTLECLPNGAYNMPMLTSLTVQHQFPKDGRITVDNLAVISHLTSLRVLRLLHCDVRDPPRYIFCNMSSLSVLDLDFSQIDSLPLPPPTIRTSTCDFTGAIALPGAFVPHPWRRAYFNFKCLGAPLPWIAMSQVPALKELAAAALLAELLMEVPSCAYPLARCVCVCVYTRICTC